MAADIEMNDDIDPIKASYDVFIRPHLKDAHMLYTLQFPNRASTQDYSATNDCEPLEVRIKQKSGLVEMDVPLDAHRNYDREKGVKWGAAMNKSDLGRGGGGASYGLPGGFGIGGAQVGRVRTVGRDADDAVNDVDLQDAHRFRMMVQEGKVLKKQTLGGQTVPKENTTPQYMIGAFYQNQLHLTPVDQIVQMRPQFHHIDAAAELDRSLKPRDPAPGLSRAAEPRAIHMTVKATVDGEEETTDTMAERIRAAQEEPWRKLEYVDDASEQAWATYRAELFVEDPDAAPRLVSSLGNAEFLDAISAPRDAARLSRAKKTKKVGTKKGNGKGKERDDGESSESSGTLDDPPSSPGADEMEE